MGSEVSLQNVFDAVTKLCREAFACEQVSLMLVDKDAQELVVRSASGHREPEKAAGHAPEARRRHRWPRGRRRRSRCCSGPGAPDPERFHALRRQHQPLTAAMVVPIRVRDELVGVLNVASHASADRLRRRGSAGLAGLRRERRRLHPSRRAGRVDAPAHPPLRCQRHKRRPAPPGRAAPLADREPALSDPLPPLRDRPAGAHRGVSQCHEVPAERLPKRYTPRAGEEHARGGPGAVGCRPMVGAASEWPAALTGRGHAMDGSAGGSRPCWLAGGSCRRSSCRVLAFRPEPCLIRAGRRGASRARPRRGTASSPQTVAKSTPAATGRAGRP